MQARNWCYTYNNYTDETKNFIPDVECTYRVQGYETGSKCGTPHIQGYVRFKKVYRLATLQKLYPRGIHWESSKGSPWTNRKYCTKDGVFEEFGEVPEGPKKKQTADDAYGEALSKGTVAEALRVIKEKRPRDYCLYGEAIERNIKRSKSSSYQGIYNMEAFSQAPRPLNKSTLIWGDSNLGKTHYALAHFKNPLLVSHIDKLKQLNSDYDGIVFDDMSFRHWPPEAVIHLLDQDFDRDINIRYGTVSVPAHTKKIFTHNTNNPFYVDSIDDSQKDAIKRRLDVVQAIKLF